MHLLVRASSAAWSAIAWRRTSSCAITLGGQDPVSCLRCVSERQARLYDATIAPEPWPSAVPQQRTGVEAETRFAAGRAS